VSEGFASYQWYFNGVAMKGGNNYYINTNEPGNYSVTVTTDYGCVTESGVYILIISVEEQENTLINLFPIPARELINVQLTTPAPWAITDISGRTIMADLAASSVFTINIESLPVGVYFLQANESRIRFVKE
jgi:presenilin-like A22 family membrane protease